EERELAGDVVALLHALEPLHALDEPPLEARVLEEHLDERRHLRADGGGIDDGCPAPDDTRRLELLHPLVHGRGRDADAFRVLGPETWPVLGAHFGVPEFSFTTRDFADFDELMRRRVAAAARAGLKLADLQSLAHAVEPFLGAREFLARLRMLGNVVIISDTF